MSNNDYDYSSEFPEEPNDFTLALEEAICGEKNVLDYPETEHPPLEDIL